MQRSRKITVLAFGEGEREKIFLRHISACYRRTNMVTVIVSSAGGGSPQYILDQAIRYRNGQKRDVEFILLDTKPDWPIEMIDIAKVEDIKLLGSAPCVESFLLEILELKSPDTKYKDYFESLCLNQKFDEDECRRLFPKAVLNSAREKIPMLNEIISMIESENINLNEDGAF